MPLPSRLRSHLDCPYRQVLGALFKLVIDTCTSGKADTTSNNTGNHSTGSVSTTELRATLAAMAERLTHMVQEQNASEDNLWNKCTSTELAVNTVEVRTYHTYTLHTHTYTYL